MTKTIIYVSSNRETPEFEAKTRQTLLDNCGGLPIVSVTQKPIDLGKNICVGDVGVSGFNFYRQILIACEEAKSDFVISAESDCIYPPDYFAFTPTKTDVCYRDSNIYLLPYKRNYFLKKDSSTFAQVIDRKYYIARLKYLFRGAPRWNTKEFSFPKERWHRNTGVFDTYEFFETPNGCISFKTGLGMRRYSASYRIPIYELPYWGKAENIRKKYLG